MVRLTDPVRRVDELERLHNDCRRSIDALEPEFILQGIPEDSKEWKIAFQMLSDHVGRMMAKSKLIGVDTTIMKELREIKRKENPKTNTKVISAEKIREIDDPEEVKERMRELAEGADLPLPNSAAKLEPVAAGAGETSL